MKTLHACTGVRVFYSPFLYKSYLFVCLVVLQLAATCETFGQSNIYPTSGNVGIGTTSPATPLHIRENGSPVWISLDKNPQMETGLQFRKNGMTQFYMYTDNIDNDALKIQATTVTGEDDLHPRIFIPSDNSNLYFALSGGNVGIGTTTPNERLTVLGTIYGREVKVDLSVPGPDYVFEDDYELPSIDELQEYIETQKHLPGVPSAAEMAEEGINVGEMNMILLKKIEELTLYVIELKKENEAIKREIGLK